MSQSPTGSGGTGGGGDGRGSLDTRRSRRPGASVTLRQGESQGESMSTLLDPAAKSLADALRITYRLLQVAMVAIVGIFFLSGFKQIKESERGLRLQFGKIEAAELTPGFHFSLPEPLGEMVRVQTGEERIELNKPFFPNITPDLEAKIKGPEGVQALADQGSDALDPDADGALLTADGNIVHARVTVTYRRVNSAKALKSITEGKFDDDPRSTQTIENKLVELAVRRGMIHAAASVSIDEFLKNQPDPDRKPGQYQPIEQLTREFAQDVLSALDSGIEIQTLAVGSRMPPTRLLNDFNKVQSSQSVANKALQDAESQRLQDLNASAGEAAEMILTKIDEYDRSLALGQKDKADATLSTIHRLLQRAPVVVDGKELVANVTGQVSQTLSSAEEYRTSVVTRARADAALFVAKREAFRANPQVYIVNEWTDAFKTLLARDQTQTMMLPGNLDRMVLMLNRDPEIKKAQETKLREDEAKKNQEERILERVRNNANKRFTGDSGG